MSLGSAWLWLLACLLACFMTAICVGFPLNLPCFFPWKPFLFFLRTDLNFPFLFLQLCSSRSIDKFKIQPNKTLITWNNTLAISTLEEKMCPQNMQRLLGEKIGMNFKMTDLWIIEEQIWIVFRKTRV